MAGVGWRSLYGVSTPQSENINAKTLYLVVLWDSWGFMGRRERIPMLVKTGGKTEGLVLFREAQETLNCRSESCALL